MSRVLNVVRLQLINKQTFVWVPLLVLVGAVIISVMIYAMIPVDTPKYGGGGQAPLWYFFAIGLSALTLTFPFSQAMSITRREFFLGTMIAAVAGAALMAIVFVLGGLAEIATNGWGINGYVFYLPWMWEAGPLAAGLSYFTLAMFFFVVGFAGATLYKRSGPLLTTVVSVGIGLLLVAVLFLITRLELWGQVGEAFMTLGSLGLTLCGLGLIAVIAVVSFLTLRRATP